MIELTPEALKRCRDEAEEHVRLGGFANSQTWIQECPPTFVLALLDALQEGAERVKALEAKLDAANASLGHAYANLAVQWHEEGQMPEWQSEITISKEDRE